MMVSSLWFLRSGFASSEEKMRLLPEGYNPARNGNFICREWIIDSQFLASAHQPH
jgi:hypothetical protein